MQRESVAKEERPVASAKEEAFQAAREEMVERQIRRRGISDERVLRAMRTVPRHEFVPTELQGRAYEDVPLPIGEGQTISQPYIVASMTASLGLRGTEKVLEIGTGCGYQAAVLACLASEVHSVEVRPALASRAGERLRRLGYWNVRLHGGDGSCGLVEFAPFDAVLVAATAPKLPEPLLEQLAADGRMIAPVGEGNREALVYAKKLGREITFERRESCRFVPLKGQFGWRDV